MSGKAPSEMSALQPYRGKPAVRNDRGDRGNVGIIEARSAPRSYPTGRTCANSGHYKALCACVDRTFVNPNSSRRRPEKIRRSASGDVRRNLKNLIDFAYPSLSSIAVKKCSSARLTIRRSAGLLSQNGKINGP